MMYPFLFAPDILRAKLSITEDQVGDEEFYRRRIKALQALLTEMAAGFGLGPAAGKSSGDGTLMDRAGRILRDGD